MFVLIFLLYDMYAYINGQKKEYSPNVKKKKKNKQILTKWNMFLKAHYHDEDVQAKPARQRFSAIVIKYCTRIKNESAY